MPIHEQKDKKAELLKILEKAYAEAESNNLSMYFVKKPSSEKIQAFQPQISTDVQYELSMMILPNAISFLKNSALSEYNPVGVPDGEMENIAATSVPQVATFLDAITDEHVFKDMSLLTIGHIKYYCIRYTYDGKDLYLFRQFSKMKKLRSGYGTADILLD